MLKAAHLSKRYGAITSLCNVTVEADPGDVVVITGASGAGKSTLLRCIALLESFDSGEVCLNGVTFAPTHKTARRPYSPNPAFPFLTMVFQQLFLWPHLTNRQNITLPDIKITTRPGGFGFEELVEELDLRKVLDRFPNECSVGERQRIALARGLMLNTRFLLLDEVTSALNHDLAQRVVTLLAQAKARQVGQLIVTHDERIFANVATHVAILEDGKLRET